MREALPYAVGVAISPIPIAAILLLLTCRSAVRNGVSFLLGWTLGVAALTFVLFELVDDAGVTDSDPAWIAGVDMLLGAAFLLATAAVWRRRRVRRAGPAASWLRSVDGVTTGRAAALGVVLSGANPKVYALTLGAALAVAQAEAGGVATGEAVAAFSAIAATGVLVPLAIYVAAPDRSESLLTRMRAWLERHETNVLVVLGLLIGVLFLADGLSRL